MSISEKARRLETGGILDTDAKGEGEFNNQELLANLESRTGTTSKINTFPNISPSVKSARNDATPSFTYIERRDDSILMLKLELIFGWEWVIL